MTHTKPSITANPDYVAGQLSRALATASQHADAATRTRAEAKARRLRAALEGMLDGTVAAGSRTPVADTPAWATLEVVKGGFATGNLLAGGALRPHEETLASKLGLTRRERARAVLNAWHLGDEGFATLRTMLKSGCYRVEVPEEGALLVAAWLNEHGASERAHDLLDGLVGWFERLRFYPVPAERAPAASALVRLQPVRDTEATMRAVKVQRQVARMNETLRVWSPFEDRLVALVRETLDGEAPRVVLGPDGSVASNGYGGAVVTGASPFATMTASWQARARAALDEFDTLRHAHTLNKRAHDMKSNLSRLVGAVRSAVAHPEAVPQRACGIARTCLATIAHKRGERLADLRAAQAVTAGRAANHDLAALVADRLRAWPADGGYTSLDALMAPLDAGEARRVGVAAGVAVPAAFEARLSRSLEAPVEELVAKGVIPSGEVLATVAPQVTSQVRAAGITDPELRRLYEAVYVAFRKRRSLLLLDLQSQVRIEELPWVAAIDQERRAGVGAETASRQTLERLAALALRAYPEVILPNKLITELQALANGAGLELPLVEELAADIFMGTFSHKFVRNAQLAARVLRGTVYERYYGLSYDAVLRLPVPAAPEKKRSRWATASSGASAEFAALCESRARVEKARAWSVARNGAIVEQQQIVTTHNLGALFSVLGLDAQLGDEVYALAQRCLTSILRQHAQRIDDRHGQLLRLKNTGYAWRQMMFFLAVSPAGSLARFVAWCDEEATRYEDAAAKLSPALRGLRLMAEGRAFDQDGAAECGGPARRFLGWSTGQHWLMPR